MAFGLSTRLLSVRVHGPRASLVPGASVPADILERMRKTTTREEGLEEGTKIAHETLQRVRREVAGVQVAAPMGRIDGVISILDPDRE